MKVQIIKSMLVAGMALLAFGGTTRAQDNDGCSNATISGDYAFRISGEIFVPDTSTTPPTPTTAVLAYRDGVAMTHFNGNGKLTQVDFVMANGETPSQQTPPPDPKNIDPKQGSRRENGALTRSTPIVPAQLQSISLRLWAWIPGT